MQRNTPSLQTREVPVMTAEDYPYFDDRTDAGAQLATFLPDGIGRDWLVLALPRGGVPVAVALARHLGATLDLLVVRKVGAPRNPELALAAVTGPGADQLVVNDRVRRMLEVDDATLQELARTQVSEVARRQAMWKGARGDVAIKGRKVLIVDDGVATGTTLAAAVRAVRQQGAAEIAIAVPVALKGALARYAGTDITVICPYPDAPLFAVGQAYRNFPQVADTEVLTLMQAVDAG